MFLNTIYIVKAKLQISSGFVPKKHSQKHSWFFCLKIQTNRILSRYIFYWYSFKRTIGLEATLKLKPFPHFYLYWKLHKCNISLICQRQERATTLQLYEVVEGFFLDSSFYAIQLKSLMPQKSCKEKVFFSFWYYTST